MSRSDSPEVGSREKEKVSLSPEAKQARYTCNIRSSLSHEAKQARYTCNIRRRLSHEATQTPHMKYTSFFKP